MWTDNVTVQIILALEGKNRMYSITELCKTINTVNRDVISQRINILERKGYVFFERPRDNARVKSIVISDFGLELAGALLQASKLLLEGDKRELEQSKKVF